MECGSRFEGLGLGLSRVSVLRLFWAGTVDWARVAFRCRPNLILAAVAVHDWNSSPFSIRLLQFSMAAASSLGLLVRSP